MNSKPFCSNRIDRFSNYLFALNGFKSRCILLCASGPLAIRNMIQKKRQSLAKQLALNNSVSYRILKLGANQCYCINT